jgi:hypothetical protein
MVVILAVMFLPIFPITYTVTEPYTITKPYTVTETYTVTEPYQVVKPESVSLVNDKPTVPARYYVYYREYIDIAEKKENVIYVSVVETAGYDINFYVFDQKNFNAWKEGSSAQAYISANRIKSYNYSFVPDHSDYYYFVLDNTYSWFTNKVPSITVTWSYKITVTEYRTITEYKTITENRTITEYRDVTKTKYVSLFQLLTGNL